MEIEAVILYNKLASLSQKEYGFRASIAVQQIKLPLGISTSHILMPRIKFPSASDLASYYWAYHKGSGDCASTWVPTTDVADLDRIPGCWLL